MKKRRSRLIRDLNKALGNDEVEKTDVNIPCVCNSGFDVECRCSYYNNFKNFDTIEIKNSEILSGVPRYRLLKNPNKAMQALYNKQIYEIDSYTNIFISEEIQGDAWGENGEFYITGNFKDNRNYDNKEFILFLSYPIEAKAKCSIVKNKIKCISGSYFKQKEIMIEQQEAFTVYISEELFAITSIKSKTPLTCIIRTIDIPKEDEIIQYISNLHHSDIEEKIETEKTNSNDTI